MPVNPATDIDEHGMTGLERAQGLKPSPVPVYLNKDMPEALQYEVWFNGSSDEVMQWTEVHTLSCWGRRYIMIDDGRFMVDDDGNLRTEKVYGNFELRRMTQ